MYKSNFWGQGIVCLIFCVQKKLTNKLISVSQGWVVTSALLESKKIETVIEHLKEKYDIMSRKL